MLSKKTSKFFWKKRKYISTFIMTTFIVIMANFFAPNKIYSQVAATQDNFYDIAIIEGHVWAVGYYGNILYWQEKNQTWRIQPSGTRQALFAVFFVDANKGCIVGEAGTILTTANGGKTWSLQNSPVSQDLFNVHFVNQNRGWISGAFGTVLHTSDGGKHWEDQSISQDLDFYGLHFTDNKRGWLVGEFAMIFHTMDGGKTWNKQQNPLEIHPDSGKSQCLFQINFADHLKGWATGIDGEIMHTTDGGKSWQMISKVSPGHLLGLCVTEEGFVSVGAKGVVIDARHTPPKCFTLGSVDLNSIDLKGKRGMIIGNNGTVFRSYDGGKRWENMIIDLSSQKGSAG